MIAKKIALKDLAYFKTGGDSLGVFFPSSHEELKESLTQVEKTKKPLMILG